jgi:hypothetical protein
MWSVRRLYNKVYRITPAVQHIVFHYSPPLYQMTNVTSGGIAVVREHQLQKNPTPPFYQRRNNERRKKNKSLDTTNIWPWVPAGLDAKSDRAGWLPAVSYCSALLYTSS